MTIQFTDSIRVFSLDTLPVLTRYMEIKNSMGQSMDGFTQRTGASHNDPVIYKHFTTDIYPKVKQILGHDVKPTYTFLSRYAKGAELKSHIDKGNQCFYTVSHTIYCDPHYSAAEWYIDVDGSRVGLSVGQAVLFRGRDLVHWRPRMPDIINEYINVYFHFAPMDYVGDMS